MGYKPGRFSFNTSGGREQCEVQERTNSNEILPDFTLTVKLFWKEV